MPTPAARLSPTLGAPAPLLDALARAKGAWLRAADVTALLRSRDRAAFPLSADPASRPPSGSLFHFDRRLVRHFRRDGHAWRTKADGRTTRETHEKLRKGSPDALNCYYAHSAAKDGLQVRGPMGWGACVRG